MRFNIPSIHLGLIDSESKIWKLGHLSGQLMRTGNSGADNIGGKSIFYLLIIFVLNYEVQEAVFLCYLKTIF